jgi:hypothetical protein
MRSSPFSNEAMAKSRNLCKDDGCNWEACLEVTQKIPLTPFTKGGTQGLIFIVHGCAQSMTIT